MRTDNLRPFRFSFVVEGRPQVWIRFYSNGMEAALEDCKTIALKEYPTATAFSIESDQDSPEIRKSWGLPT